MYDIKVFPCFTAPPNSSQDDLEFLDELKCLRENNDARFINLSIYDYDRPSPGIIHFVTYPMDWILKYVRNQYANSDPLLKLDYRRLSHTDWQDFQHTQESLEIFNAFTEYGLGNQGLTCAHHMHQNMYCAVSMTFQMDEAEWVNHKTCNMASYRFQISQISSRYKEIYLKIPKNEYRITEREAECLFWVAMGKTDEQIASTLKIGKWTVVSHLKSAKYKLECPNRAAAVAVALSTGIIDLNKKT